MVILPSSTVVENKEPAYVSIYSVLALTLFCGNSDYPLNGRKGDPVCPRRARTRTLQLLRLGVTSWIYLQIDD